MITAGVGSWEYIDEYMTAPRFEALKKHWLASPPTHVSLAALAFGFGALKVKKTTAEASSPDDALREMAAAGVQIPGVKWPIKK